MVEHTTHNPKIEGLNPACHWHRERENVKKINNALCVIKLFLKSVMKFSGGAKLRVVTSNIAFKTGFSDGIRKAS